MEKNTYTEKYAKTKLILFLFISLFIFYVYTRTMPMGDVHEKAYMLHFFSILFSFIIMVSILLLDIQDYSRKDWVLASLFGILSIGSTIPVNVMGILKGICVFFTYLASKTLYGNYSTRMNLFTATNIKKFLDDLKWILIVSFPFILSKFISILRSNKQIYLYLQPNVLFRALGVGISEEVIFRLFLFAVIVRVSKGDVESNFLAILIMVLPFAIFHLVDMGIYQGILAAFMNSLSIAIVSTAVTLLALKRNVFTAIGAHFLIDLINFVFLIR